MADEKYATLPGIVTNEPDVYETSDLPEEDQHNNDDYVDDSIETLDVGHAEAFERFKNQSVDTAKADFSGRLRKHRAKGYSVSKTEYELSGKDEIPETMQEKYQRLLIEVRELTEDVTKIQNNQKSDSSTEKLSSGDLGKQVEFLQRQLNDINLEETVGTAVKSEPLDSQASELIGRLEMAAKKQDKKESSENNATQLTYTMNARPEQAKYIHASRAAALEQRLERLEATLGGRQEKLFSLTAECADKSVVGALMHLSRKVQTLDSAQLEFIEGRIHALGQKMNSVSEKKGADFSEKDSKVLELYNLVHKVDAISDTLPDLVERLTATSELHTQALQFIQTLKHLESQQSEVKGQLLDSQTLLNQTNKTLSENMATIKENVAATQTRIKELSGGK